MKTFIQIIVIFLLVSTLCICAIKPEMHKSVLVYNSDYKLVTENDVQVEAEQIPIMEVIVQPQVQTVKQNVETVTQPKTLKTVKNAVQKPQNHASNQILQSEIKNTVKSTSEPVKTEQNIKPYTKTVIKQEQNQEPKTVQTNTIKTPKVLTQQEEEIAWNVWRSNLQNKIMQDVKMPILPNGIIFRFSFLVDKYGKISNIYTSSDNSAFTPYAVQYIAPVIRSYQGKSILNFPEGSSRITTEFKGGWKISSNERLSTPQDYNDYEKVIKVN